MSLIIGFKTDINVSWGISGFSGSQYAPRNAAPWFVIRAGNSSGTSTSAQCSKHIFLVLVFPALSTIVLGVRNICHDKCPMHL